MLILDPIDGTKELVKLRPECAYSLAIFNSSNIDDPKNISIVFNPFTGFEVSTFTPLVEKKMFTKKHSTFVSRTEFESNLYEKYLNKDLEINPMGSIAFKLSLLASHKCDFIVSLKPKNIWDLSLIHI